MWLGSKSSPSSSFAGSNWLIFCTISLLLLKSVNRCSEMLTWFLLYILHLWTASCPRLRAAIKLTFAHFSSETAFSLPLISIQIFVLVLNLSSNIWLVVVCQFLTTYETCCWTNLVSDEHMWMCPRSFWTIRLLQNFPFSSTYPCSINAH